MKLREGNVLTGVCLSTGGVSNDHHQVSLAGLGMSSGWVCRGGVCPRGMSMSRGGGIPGPIPYTPLDMGPGLPPHWY